MRQSRYVGAALVFSALGAWVGCSSNSSPTRAGGASGSSGTTAGSGASGATSLGSGGSAGTGTIATSGGAGGMQSCAATTTTAKLIPLDLYVLMDSSKSMNEQTAAGPSKWSAITAAMSAFFNDTNSAGISIALKYFPDEQPSVPETCTSDTDCASFGPCDQRKACVTSGTFSKTVTTLCSTAADCASNEVCVPVQQCSDGPNCAKVYCVSSGSATPCSSDCTPFQNYCRNRDVCSSANYATPVVPFATLPDAASTLVASFNGHMPGGYTPTGPALSGALEAAQARAQANPDHKVAVVLVTDGLPGGFIPGNPPPACVPSDIPGVASLLSTGAGGMPPIPTFVIGVFGPCDLVDMNVMPQANLDALAAAGNTTKAVVINTAQDVSAQLQSALKLVRTAAITCQYVIPTDMGQLDYNKVNVNFTSSTTATTTIGYAGSKAACDARGGWYYDVDPTKGTPTQIIACDASCTQFQAATDARVDIALGCATQPVR